MKQVMSATFCFLLMVSCVKDFDELEDTDQRYITFSVDCSSIFSDILSYTDSGIVLGCPVVIPDSMRLRVCAYCYDAQDSLISKKTVLTKDDLNPKLTIKHLLKDTKYHFIIVADVVKYDLFVDYYETWFQLGTASLNDFYFYSSGGDGADAYKTLKYCQMDAIPGNQSVNVKLEALTYNGFCIFVNTRGIDKLSGYIGYSEYFVMRTCFTDKYILHSFVYYMPLVDTLLIPVTLAKTNDCLRLRVESNMVNRKDTAYFFPDLENRPFSLTIDCKRLIISNVKEY